MVFPLNKNGILNNMPPLLLQLIRKIIPDKPFINQAHQIGHQIML